MQPSLWARCHHLARCSLPGTGLSHKRERHMRRRAVSHRPQTISSLLGLAPGGGYLATRITACAGGLLHHLFTITPSSHAGVRGCLFLWPLSGRLRFSACSHPLGMRFPRPGCYPTPCSMECGLSSIPTTQDRDCPTNLRKCMIHARQKAVNIPKVDISGKDIKIERHLSIKR